MVEDLYYLHTWGGGGDSRSGSTCPGKPGKGEHKILPHMVFNKRLGRYMAKKGGSTNLMDLQITLDKESFERLAPPEARLPTKSTMTSSTGIGDTGATICCTGTQMLDQLGIKKRHLLKSSLILTVADNRVVTILGVVPVYITTRRAISKEGVHTRKFLYIFKELT